MLFIFWMIILLYLHFPFNLFTKSFHIFLIFDYLYCPYEATHIFVFCIASLFRYRVCVRCRVCISYRLNLLYCSIYY